MSHEQGPIAEQSSRIAYIGDFIKEKTGRIAVATIAGVTFGGAMMAQGSDTTPSEVNNGVPCDPNMDVCVPGITAPEDAEPVPGNTEEGEEIEIDPEFDDKGPETTTTSIPETTTTVPETTTTTPNTTTTTTVPETTTTIPTLPVTVPQPTVPTESN